MSEALGMIECLNFPAVLEASNVMLKMGKVELVSLERTGGGRVTVIVRGEQSVVQVAVSAGVKAARDVGEVLSLNIIPAPHHALLGHLKSFMLPPN